jgi:hypothetical protein
VTKDEKIIELVNRAVAHLKTFPPPAGVSDAAAIKEYYAIFDAPVRWKAGVRTLEEVFAPVRRASFGFKMRERGKPLAVSQMN